MIIQNDIEFIDKNNEKVNAQRIDDNEEESDEDVEDFEMSEGDLINLDIEHLNTIMKVMDIDETEAEKVLALGKYLGEYFSSIQYDWEEEDESSCRYSYGGRKYYIGTWSDLNSVAEDIVQNDSQYEDFWRDAVRSEQTQESLADWLDSIVDIDGFESVLGSYDGCYHTVSVKGKELCICRS